MIKIPFGMANRTDAKFVYYWKEQPDFPLITMGVGSYMVTGVIRTSIEQDFRVQRNPVHNIHVGNYTAIAVDTSFVVGSNHNYRALAQGGPGPGGYCPPDLETLWPNKGQIIVQNDVWIGNDVSIMGGVTIHNGAVIAANSHVVKDVPPYAIVGGNPARILKYRFSPQTINKLQLIRWWDWPIEKIKENRNWFSSYKIEEFCNYYLPAAIEEKNKTLSLRDKRLIDGSVIIFFLDSVDKYSLWQKVIKLYIMYYSKGNRLVLVKSPSESINQEVLNYIEQYPKESIKNIIFMGNERSARSFISDADYYIPNRDVNTVIRSEYAYEYNAKILSAVDTCGFDL